MTDIFLKCDDSTTLYWKTADQSAWTQLTTDTDRPVICEDSSDTVTFHFRKSNDSDHNIDYSPTAPTSSTTGVELKHSREDDQDLRVNSGAGQNVYFREHGSGHTWYSGYVKVVADVRDS